MCLHFTFLHTNLLAVMVELLSSASEVDSLATVVDQSSDAVLGADMIALDELPGVSRALQLPDGTFAVIKNLSQRRYQCSSCIVVGSFT